MRKRVKYLLVLGIIVLVMVEKVNLSLKEKERLETEISLDEKEKSLTSEYSIKRKNNQYTVIGSKLEKKKLTGIFYDDVNVYLYYEGDNVATFLRYNIESSKIKVIFEDSSDIYGGASKIGNYYKLGNVIYNDKFKKVMDYPVLQENELLFPDCTRKLVKTDTGVKVIHLDTLEEDEVIANEKDSYSPYFISLDGEYFLLKRDKDDKSYLVVFDSNYDVINTFDYSSLEDKKYFLLGDKPYLVFMVTKDLKTTYRIYDTRTKEEIYRSKKISKPYQFDFTKFVFLDSDLNIKLMDYVTSEEKILINYSDSKKDISPKKMILASDGYSVLLTLDGMDNVFYIFYL